MGQTTETIYIEGMSCDHCVKAVRDALEEVEGVEVEDVQVGTARVRYDRNRDKQWEVMQAIMDAGYKPHLSADAV